MNGSPRVRCVLSPSAASRLDAARAFALAFPSSQPVTIVAATRGAADDFARAVARTRPATIGLSRFSLTQLAARIAAPRLAGRGVAPASALALEAVAARAAFETARHDRLSVLTPVAAAPGFPRALARTFADLRLAEVSAARVGEAEGRPAILDLSRLVAEADEELREAHVADRARLFAAAAESVAGEPFLANPLILLDLELGAPIEDAFAVALAAAARRALVTAPSQDEAARHPTPTRGGTGVSRAARVRRRGAVRESLRGVPLARPAAGGGGAGGGVGTAGRRALCGGDRHR